MTDSCAQTPWTLAPADAETVAALSRDTGLSLITARILASRGYVTPAAVERFLAPDLDRDWLDPDLIPGMPAAADEIAAAIRDGERIVVFGDFDLDGVSAAAVAARGLRALGADVTAIVPHRFREGYGLSEAAIERLLPLDPKLVVTVDCGISSADEVALLAERGVRVVVTDHHEPGDGRSSRRPCGQSEARHGGLRLTRPVRQRRRAQAGPRRRSSAWRACRVAGAHRSRDAGDGRRHRAAVGREPRAGG